MHTMLWMKDKQGEDTRERLESLGIRITGRGLDYFFGQLPEGWKENDSNFPDETFIIDPSGETKIRNCSTTDRFLEFKT